MPDDNQTFWGQINATNAAQLLSFAANFGQVSGIAVQIAMGIISALSESDTQLILDAINQLQAQLQTDFVQLGNLIVQQAKIIEQTIDRDEMATALGHSDAALSDLNTFLQSKNPTDLSLASNESAIGVGFFLNQSQIPPNLFFMPGLVKAGTQRILVIVLQTPDFLVARPDEVVQIRQMIILLKSMIDVIRNQVDGAHVVTEKSHVVRSFPTRRIIIDGYAHDEDIKDDDGNTVRKELQFFPTGGLTDDPNDPRVLHALEQAENARNQGVSDELAFMGIPGFDAVLQHWKHVITNPLSLPGHVSTT